MAKRKLKRGSELNGRYNLRGNGDYMLVQYYEGIDSYYCIINSEAGLQVGLSLAQLRRLIKEHCTDPQALNLF